DAENVLDPDRHAEQRLVIVRTGVDHGGLRERVGFVVAQERLDLPINFFHAIDAGLREVARGYFFGADAANGFRNRQFVEHLIRRFWEPGKARWPWRVRCATR